MSYTDGAGFGIGRIVWTPSAVKAEGERVDTAVEILNNDIHSWGDKITSAQYPEQSEAEFEKALKVNEFVVSWDKFVKEWKKFKSDYSSWWGSNVDSIHNYENQVKKWRDEFTKVSGLQPTGPEPQAHEPSTFLGLNWNKVFWAGAILGGAWLTVEAIKAIAQWKTSTPTRRALPAKK